MDSPLCFAREGFHSPQVIIYWNLEPGSEAPDDGAYEKSDCPTALAQISVSKAHILRHHVDYTAPSHIPVLVTPLLRPANVNTRARKAGGFSLYFAALCNYILHADTLTSCANMFSSVQSKQANFLNPQERKEGGGTKMYAPTLRWSNRHSTEDPDFTFFYWGQRTCTR